MFNKMTTEKMTTEKKDSPLKRTDSKAILPKNFSYIKDSKYDKPQKNARKIKWEDDEEQISMFKRWEIDSKLMPPPSGRPPEPPNSPPYLENKRKRHDSPHPKKFKKRNI